MTPTPVWRRRYRRHDPLTCTWARTLTEVDDEAYRSSLELPRSSDRSHRILDRLCWIAAFALLAVALSSPYWWSR